MYNNVADYMNLNKYFLEKHWYKYKNVTYITPCLPEFKQILVTHITLHTQQCYIWNISNLLTKMFGTE
jgi:hypothetical protein